jgi:hypothetical protein
MLKSLVDLPEWHAACKRYRYDLPRFAIEALGMEITWQQYELYTSIAVPGSRTSVSSGHGCFGIDTPIKMFNGSFKPVQDIEEDDLVMGEDNQSSRTVTHVLRGKERLYKVRYKNGKCGIFNESHILCLLDEAGHRLTITLKKFLEFKRPKQRRFSFYKWTKKGFERVEIQSIKSIGKGDYYGFELLHNHMFLGEDDVVLHNTGKTRSAGVCALWHLLFFPFSIMLFTAPQIDQLRKLVWKEIEICKDLMKTRRLAWMVDYIEVLAESVYIKGFQKTWHIFAKTAPPNKPTNLAGLHAKYLFIWGDEAAGIEDPVFDVLTNALTEEDNRMALTSQPAKPTGFFYDTHHKLSMAAGGIWNSLIFNSEDSPIVSIRKIKEALLQYGSRDDPSYLIRIRGLFPDLAGEFLITYKNARKAWQGRSLKDKKFKEYGYFMAVDVGGGVGRDDSAIVIGRVWGNAKFGERARRIEIIDVPLCKNNDNIQELAGIINNCLIQYPNISILLDANGTGAGLAQYLTSIGITYRRIHWGGQCFQTTDKKMYVNQRAQAFVALGRAIAENRFKIRTLLFKSKIEEQLTRIPYTFDDQARYKILSKEEMKRRGIKSPDLVDTFAFMFLTASAYMVAEDSFTKDINHQGAGRSSDQIEAEAVLAEADEFSDLLS